MNAEEDGRMETNEANHLCGYVSLVIDKRREERSKRIFTLTKFLLEFV